MIGVDAVTYAAQVIEFESLGYRTMHEQERMPMDRDETSVDVRPRVAGPIRAVLPEPAAPDTKKTAANAPGNTCIVIWQANPGYVGPWQPTLRYWSYK